MTYIKHYGLSYIIYKILYTLSIRLAGYTARLVLMTSARALMRLMDVLSTHGRE